MMVLTRICFAGEKRLVILGGEIHVVVRKGLLFRRLLKTLIFGTTKQVQRVPPDLALGYNATVSKAWRWMSSIDPVGIAVDIFSATQPGGYVVQGDLLYEGHSVSTGQEKSYTLESKVSICLTVPAIVPPLKNEDEARDQRRRAGQGHVKFGRQRRQEHCRHSNVLGNSQWSTQVVEDESDLETSMLDGL